LENATKPALLADFVRGLGVQTLFVPFKMMSKVAHTFPKGVFLPDSLVRNF